ncbi:MAG: ABC transporter permease [Terriglobales bacterium]
MRAGLRWRLASAAATVLISLLLCFALGQLTPGDAFTALEMDPSVPPATLAHLRALYEPHQPLFERLGAWLAGLGRGEWGYSLQYHRPVLSLLRHRLPLSLELMGLGLAMAWALGLCLALLPAWLGEHARWRTERLLEGLLHGAGALVTGLPLGVLAVLALVWAPVAWLPAGAQPSPWLPAAVLALAFLPTIYFQAAHALTRVRQRGFVQQARANGLGPARIVLLHVLPNCSDVLVPIASLTLSQALIELVILEPLLGWPGVGQLSIQAAESRDMPVLAALVLITSLLVIGSNWASELVQYWLNPQLQSRRQFAQTAGAE